MATIALLTLTIVVVVVVDVVVIVIVEVAILITKTIGKTIAQLAVMKVEQFIMMVLIMLIISGLYWYCYHVIPR